MLYNRGSEVRKEAEEVAEKNTGFLRRLRRKIAAGLLAVSLAVLPAAGPVAQAASIDPIGALAAVFGVTGAYSAYLETVLDFGNNAHYQAMTRTEDMKKNGADKNAADTELVNSIMQQLVAQGDYVLDIRSLPFQWGVNDSKEFNACCFPTDYISVNRGLVAGMDYNVDEIAAVLGHEMTHGIKQHGAYNYAKAIAQYFGLTLLNMATDAMNANVMNVLADYSIAKNVTLPTEYAADEGGFYLMAAAGFNPGGPAAAMARMQYYTDHLADFTEVFEPYDHPDTDKREAKLLEMMTEYSCGHVTVKNHNEVCIDGHLLLKTDWTTLEYDNSEENAYFVAGALAKAFHDFDTTAGWNFRPGENGRVEYLTDDRVYAMLKDFVERRRGDRLLKELVAAAYGEEETSGARVRMKAAEQARQADMKMHWDKNVQAKQKRVKELYLNSDAYNDLYEPELALAESERAFSCTNNQESLAGIYAVRGRAKALLGDFAAAQADCNKAVQMDGKDAYNFLNRAEVYRAQGQPQTALADCQQAIKLDAKAPAAHKMAADIYAELGEHAPALEHYREYQKLVPKAEDIPAPYKEELTKK